MPSETPAEEIGEFIDTIWGDAEGYVYLPTRDQSTETWKKVFFEWPKHRPDVIKHILVNSGKRLDVYVAPAIFAKPNPRKENVLGSNVLWTEFDGNAPTSWQGQNVNGAPDEAGRDVAGIPTPTLRVQSSTDGHEHCYWRLNEFSTDITWVESANRSIAYESSADTSGWDRNQILRPPGSRNYKHDLPVTIIRNNDGRYARPDFKELKAPTVLVSDSINTDNLPELSGVIARYKWKGDEFEFFSKPEIDVGDRSFALMRVGYVGAEMGMSDNEIYALLVNADDRWKKFVNRDDRKRRLLDIIERARRKHPVGNDELTFRGLMQSDSDNSPVELNTQYVYRFQDFLDTKMEVEWLIEDLLEVGGFGMVASKPGIGKTQLSIQLAICCALGIPFLGWAIPRPLKVVFLSLEMSHAALSKFMSTISTGYETTQRLSLQENFYVVPLGESLLLNNRAGLDFLENLLNDTQPDLIIMDSMSKIVKKFDEESILDLNKILVRVRNKFGCAMWFVHHNRKENGDNKKPTSQDDIYGPVFISSEMTSELILWRDGKGPKDIIEIINVKNRLAPERDDFTVWRDPQTLKFMETSGMSDNAGAGLVKAVTPQDAPAKTDNPLFSMG